MYLDSLIRHIITNENTARTYKGIIRESTKGGFSMQGRSYRVVMLRYQLAHMEEKKKKTRIPISFVDIYF